MTAMRSRASGGERDKTKRFGVRKDQKIQPGRIWRPNDTAKCRKCTGPIAFKQLPSGKWCPVEVDGSAHFDICKTNQVRLGLAIHGPTEQTIGRSGPFVGSKKNLWNGKGVPWEEGHQERHVCGEKWVALRRKGLKVLLFCSRCKQVRIENPVPIAA